ncbi:MAG: Tat pathway signal protein [Atopobiaceae bacterium]|jgi:hypothetical protein
MPSRPSRLNPIVSRRQLAKGVAAAGAVAVTLDVLAGCANNTGDQAASNPVVVSSDAATSILDSFSETSTNPLKESSAWTLPLGSVPRPAEGYWIPYLAAGTTASPINICCAFSTDTEKSSTVLKAPVTGTSNVVFYDVQCSDDVYAWVEMSLIDRSWTLLASKFADGDISDDKSTLWQGDSNYDPPKFCCTGSKVFWQVMPSTSGSKTTEHSGLYVWHVGDSQAKQVIDSPGRFATDPVISGDTITVTPRVRPTQGTYYGITAYLTKDDCSTQVDQLVLPVSVKPFHAVRIGGKFAFSVEANYSTGGLLAGMGSYVGTSSGKFLTLPREPFAGITGKEGLYIIKSRASYFVVDADNQQYYILAAVDHALDYGDYPARVGECSYFVTYATTKNASTGYPVSVSVRTFDV